jgi:hypothetical protein
MAALRPVDHAGAVVRDQIAELGEGHPQVLARELRQSGGLGVHSALRSARSACFTGLTWPVRG